MREFFEDSAVCNFKVTVDEYYDKTSDCFLNDVEIEYIFTDAEFVEIATDGQSTIEHIYNYTSIGGAEFIEMKNDGCCKVVLFSNNGFTLTSFVLDYDSFTQDEIYKIKGKVLDFLKNCMSNY